MTTKTPPPRNGTHAPPPAQNAQSSTASFSVVSGRKIGPQRVVAYGPGGVGKTTLASLAPNPVFIDIGTSTGQLDVARVEGVETWADLRACLNSNVLDGYETVVIDDGTTAEEMVKAHVLSTMTNERGEKMKNIEAFGFAKGYQHVYDQFLLLLSDLDAHIRRGRNVIMICHECTANVPNPFSEDYIRFEPHLQALKSGKASTRNRVVQWADHVLFIGYDVVAKDGKGLGGGTRTIWPVERPTHVAKSRSLADPIPFNDAADGAVWSLIFGGK